MRCARFEVVHHDRLFAEVAAGHDQRVEWRAVEEQVVQRRVGQHHAEGAIARRDGLAAAPVAAGAAAERWGAANRVSAARSASDTSQSASHHREVARHQGEWLIAAPFARAQALHGRGVARIAGQVESAESFDGQNLAGREAVARFGEDRCIAVTRYQAV